MAFSTKQKLTCPKCNASKILIFGDLIGIKELKARICQKCNISMKSELCDITSHLTIYDHIYNMLRRN